MCLVGQSESMGVRRAELGEEEEVYSSTCRLRLAGCRIVVSFSLVGYPPTPGGWLGADNGMMCPR